MAVFFSLGMATLPLLISAMKYPCDKGSCPASKVSCVQTGQFCFTQSNYFNQYTSSNSYYYDPAGSFQTKDWDPENPCKYHRSISSMGALRDLCPVCSGDNVICHYGKCLALTQKEGEPCCSHPSDCEESLKYKYCQSPLLCQDAGPMNNGTCVMSNGTLEVGSACVPQDIYSICPSNTVCSNVTKVCEYVRPSNLIYCANDLDCRFGEYCQTTPDNNKTCVLAHHTLGMPCEMGQIAHDNARQCGMKYICSKFNDTSGKCIEPFSKPLGASCTSNWERECAVGYCSSDGYCEELGPDLSIGVAPCCGRGRSESCPPVGYGIVIKEACQPDVAFQETEKGRQRYNQYEKSLRACMEESKCQFYATGQVCYDKCWKKLSVGTRPIFQAPCAATFQGGFLFNNAAYTLSPVAPVILLLSASLAFLQS
eukprot:gb/GEZN01005420.1/.p1 GENE.gb/GEZN01005420.1/~~gb/GEZN01005420.1/.p1  ORF type:complete len:425 (+),score=24.20 gb/GEZN01005420.1/:37-1311(+)